MKYPTLYPRTVAALLAALTAGLLLQTPARAAANPPTIAGATLMNPDPVKSAPFLGSIYKDEGAGFSIAPPAGAKIINRPGIEMLSFVVELKSWGGNMRLTYASDDQKLAAPGHHVSVDQFAQSIANNLAKTFKAVQVLETKSMVLGSRKAVLLRLSMTAEPAALQGGRAATQPARAQPGASIALYSQQFIVEMAENQFSILTFYAPLKDKEAAGKTFDAMLGTLEFFNREELVKKRNAAAQAGKDWLNDRTAEELRGKIIPQRRWFRMLVGGADLGYLIFQEGDKQRDQGGQLVDIERDGKKGLIIEMNSRSFPPDGSIVGTRSLAFWAFSKDAQNQPRPLVSSWVNDSNRTVNIPPAPGVAPAPRTFWLSETGLIQMEGNGRFSLEQLAELKREQQARMATLTPEQRAKVIPIPEGQFHFKVTLSGDTKQDTLNIMDPSKVGVDVMMPPEAAAPLPKTLEYVWPRLVDLTKPSEMSFTVYDSNARKLALRTLIVAGKDHIILDGKSVDCFKCIDELNPGSTTLWVDATGAILLMRTSDQTVLVPTTEQEMTRLWGTRVANANPTAIGK